MELVDMANRQQANPTVVLIAVVFLFAGLGAFFYVSLIGGLPSQEKKDEVKVEILYYDVEQLPDEVNTTDPQTDEDAEGQTTTTSDSEGQTETDQQEEEEKQDTTPDPVDDRFEGEIIIKVEYVGASGNLLSILPLEFVKSVGGEPLKKLRVIYSWDFKYGSAIDPDSISFHVLGYVRRVNYQDQVDTWRSGSFTGGKVFEQTIFNIKGSNKVELDMNDHNLGFYQVGNLGSPHVMMWTGEKDFLINWEATVSTKGGTPHRIFGVIGVRTNFMWDATVADPDTTGGYLPPDYSDPYFYDPSSLHPYGGYQDTPLISIVPIG